MVSRRNFFSITLIMLVVVFMFQVPEVIKNQVNNYGENEYEELTNTGLTEESVYTASEADVKDNGRFVVFIGDIDNSSTGSVVEEWSFYTKRYLKSYKSVKDYEPDPDNLPEAVLVDPTDMDLDKDIYVLEGYTEMGIHIIFCKVPDVSEVLRIPKLMRMLGIKGVIREKIKVEGLRMMEGFLLGGLKEYILDETMEKTQQDMDLVMPWYRISGGAKMFMHGMMEDEDVEACYMMTEGDVITKNQNLPAVIWRNKYKDAMVFGVNGDYLSTNAGIGILSAMMLETKEYDIYPIINAQNLVVLNFPDLTDENQGEMMERYSQSLKAVYRDIVWPGLVSVAQQNSRKLTCMIMPQMEYLDDLIPEEDMLVYYMKLFQEQNMEMGLSGSYGEGTDVSKKLDKDVEFLDMVVPEYSMLSFYQGNMSDEKLEDTLKRERFAKVRTIFSDDKKSEQIVSFGWEGIIKQRGINDGYSHTFSENLRMLSIQTALGYSNIQVDVNPVAFPVTDEDSWEKLSRKFAGNTSTYWKSFSSFEKTTLSESDARIRKFLALDYEQEKKGNTIYVKISDFQEEAWFILRTHGEEIKYAQGAEFEKIEDGAYLITATEPQVRVELEGEQERYYYQLD